MISSIRYRDFHRSPCFFVTLRYFTCTLASCNCEDKDFNALLINVKCDGAIVKDLVGSDKKSYIRGVQKFSSFFKESFSLDAFNYNISPFLLFLEYGHRFRR